MSIKAEAKDSFDKFYYMAINPMITTNYNDLFNQLQRNWDRWEAAGVEPRLIRRAFLILIGIPGLAIRKFYYPIFAPHITDVEMLRPFLLIGSDTVPSYTTDLTNEILAHLERLQPGPDIIDHLLENCQYHVGLGTALRAYDYDLAMLCQATPRRIVDEDTYPADNVVWKVGRGCTLIKMKVLRDAFVRGDTNKIRASHVRVLRILDRDNIDITRASSLYVRGSETYYEVGTEIIIPNFDLSVARCSTGIHFYATEARARKARDRVFS